MSGDIMLGDTSRFQGDTVSGYIMSGDTSRFRGTLCQGISYQGIL